jgi:hypothetical protein
VEVVEPEHVRVNSSDTLDGPPSTFDHIGLGFADNIPTVFDNNNTNTWAAVEKRIYNNPLTICHHEGPKFCQFMQACHIVLLPEMPYCAREEIFGGHHTAYKAWNSTYRFGKILSRIHDDALAATHEGLAPRHYLRKLFIKREKKNNIGLDGCDTSFNPDLGDPRHIQTVSQAVHASLGPCIYAWSKALAIQWNVGFPVVYAAGLNGAQLYESLPEEPCYYVGDLSRYDRSIDATILHTLNSIKTRYCFSNAARQCLAAQLKTKGFTQKGGHFYQMPGQRKSGDANTSCDNSELTVYMHYWCIHSQLGYSIEWIRDNTTTLVMGDDIVVAGPIWLEQVDFAAGLSKLGFLAKPKIVYHKWEVEFCSKRFWPSNKGGVLAAKPGRALAKIGYSHLPKCPASMSSIARGLDIDNSVVPVLNEYLKRAITKPDVATMPFGEHLTERHEPTEETMAMFYHVYDSNEEEVKDFTRWIGGWNGGPAMGTHPLVTKIMGIDA